MGRINKEINKMPENKINEILNRVERVVENLESLIENFDKVPGQIRANVSRVAVEGRSVTNILENLRGKVENFDDWYKKKSDNMRNDQLLRYFYQLRTETLKKGNDKIKGIQLSLKPNASIQMSENGITVNQTYSNGKTNSIFYERPIDTVASFMADSNGGVGFVVKTSEGKEKKVYVHVPSENMDISIFFNEPPTEHLGKTITYTDAFSLCKLYFTYMRNLYEEAVIKYKK